MAEEQQKHRKESKGAFPRPAPVNLFIFFILWSTNTVLTCATAMTECSLLIPRDHQYCAKSIFLV